MVTAEKNSARERAAPARQVGRYHMTSVLGRGAMGVVYRGHDPLLNRHVAIKVMGSGLASDPAVKARFEREAQAAARLNHPNVVTVYDFGYHEGSPYVVMELLRGRDLKAVLASDETLPIERKVSIVLHVLAGLTHAHRAGVVHRDVKPANVFLVDGGGVKVLDFGMARVTWAGGSASGSILGTIDYMSPEQVEGHRVDGRSDVFSTASVLYELLSGRPPFQRESLVSTAYQIVHGPLELEPLGANTSLFGPLLEKALAKDLASRYASAFDFAQDLNDRCGVPAAELNTGEPLQLEAPEPATAAPAAGVAAAEPASSGNADANRQQETVDLGGGVSGAAAAATAPPVERRDRARGLERRLGWLGWFAAAGLAAALAATTYERFLSRSPEVVPSGAQTASPEQAGTDKTAARRATGGRARPAGTPLASAAPAFTSPGLAASASPGPAASRAPEHGDSPAAVATPLNPVPAAAHATLLPAPPPAPLVPGRWVGYITDESCKLRGAVDGHWDCAQVCIRKGFRPLLAVEGKLYHLDGVDRIQGDKNRPVTVEGLFDAKTNTIVIAGANPLR